MKIKKVEVFTLDLPLSNPLLSTFRGGFMTVETAHQVVVKVTSEDGTVGYGLTAPVPLYHGQTQAMMVKALEYLLPLVEGRNPFDIEQLHDTMDWALRGSEPAKCAIDLAIYDLLGKVVGQPAYALLGGRRHDEFLTTFTLASGRGDHLWNSQEVAEEARGLYEEGYRGFEVHIGTAPGKGYREDVQRIELLRRELGSEVEIVTDLHRNWTLKEAIVGIRALEPSNVFIEQPVADLEAMAEVRQQVGATIIADESCHTVDDGVGIVRRRAADAFCIKPIKAGGLFKAKKLATLAENFGLLTRVDGIPGEGKLSNTASAHLVLTLKHPIVCGVMQHQRVEKDLVTEGGIELSEGKVTLPDAPGLGVVVDESMLVAV